MAVYWSCSVLAFFMDLDFVSVHKNANKKELGHYSTILTSCLVNNIIYDAVIKTHDVRKYSMDIMQ